MSDPRPDVPDAELAVLRVLWQRRTQTIRQLCDALYPHGTDAHYATVQKLLERLEAKGYVKRNASNRAHAFEAAIQRNELIGVRLESVAEKLCDGSITPLITQLVRTKRLSDTELQALRELIDQLAPLRTSTPRSGRRQK